MHTRVDIRKNDMVKVIAGRGKDDKEFRRLLRVFPNEGKLLEEHVKMVKKHVRPNPKRNIKGGIAEQESRVAISNVMLACPSCQPARVGHERKGNRKYRASRKSGTSLG